MKTIMVKIVFACTVIAMIQITNSATVAGNSTLSFLNDDNYINAGKGLEYNMYIDFIDNLERGKRFSTYSAIQKKLKGETMCLSYTSVPAEYVLSWLLHFSGLGLRKEGDKFFITEGKIVGEKCQEIAALYSSKSGSMEKQINEILDNSVELEHIEAQMFYSKLLRGLKVLLLTQDVSILISPEIDLSALEKSQVNFGNPMKGLNKNVSLRKVLEKVLNRVGWQYEVKGGTVFVTDDPENQVKYSEIEEVSEEPELPEKHDKKSEEKTSEVIFSHSYSKEDDKIRVEKNAIAKERVERLPTWDPRGEDSDLPLSPGEAGRLALEALPENWGLETAAIESVMLENRFPAFSEAPFWYYEVTVIKDRTFPGNIKRIYVLLDGTVVEPTTEYVDADSIPEWERKQIKPLW